MDAVAVKPNRLADYEIFLDDERMPPAEMDGCVIVRDFWEFKRTLIERGIPKYISFDHDLGDMELTGKSCAEFFVHMVFRNKPEDLADFQFYVHSQNPVGAENIRRYLEQFLEQHA